MNVYKISYTVYDIANSSDVNHQEKLFESDADLLGAADEGMSSIHAEWVGKQPAGKEYNILFRKVELEDPKTAYKKIIKELKHATTVQTP